METLDWRSRHQPTQVAYTFDLAGNGMTTSVTYADLHDRVRTMAGHLAAGDEPGTRVLILCPPGLDYAVSFLACLYAGMIAVPAYAPRGRRTGERIVSIATDARPGIVVASSSVRDRILAGPKAIDELCTPRWVDPGQLATDRRAEPWRPPAIASEDLAFLQYTSGSTSDPKGVMVSHANLLHNLAAAQEALDYTLDSVGVLWLPPHHDMGLIGGLLQPLHAGFPVVLMSPLAFVQDPTRWLRAIQRYGATHSGAPSSAYHQCVLRVSDEACASLDLSTWRCAINGAEPVRADVIDQFVERFGPCGFRRSAFTPCYGLAECTIFVTGRRDDSGPRIVPFDRTALQQRRAVPAPPTATDARALVSAGPCAPGMQVTIVDPDTGEACGPDRVGEIWVTGPSVAQGYWQRPDASASTFAATLPGAGATRHLRTGDQGVLRDGELYVTGRLSDLIVIRGQNHHPQDIEATAARSDPRLQPDRGAAFPVTIDEDERLVVVQEAPRQVEPDDVPGLLAAVRSAVAEEHDLQPHTIVLVRHGSIPLTTSGKIQRRLCRSRFEAGELDEIGRWTRPPAAARPTARPDGGPGMRSGSRTVSDIRSWLQAAIAARLGAEPASIDVHQPFISLGLDSVHGVEIAAELETWLGRAVSPTLAWDHPSIESASRHLGGQRHAATVDGGGSATDDVVAIVGMGCRFPGGVDSPESFWHLLQGSGDAIIEVPPARWSLERHFDPDPEVPGKTYSRHGGFLRDVDGFDARFFGITPREARSMDPQQRLLLEVAWEALEDGAIAPDTLQGTSTGVFVGISTSDYLQLGSRVDTELIDAYVGTGNAPSVASGRLSYLLGLHGPSVAVDTACSSSLVAVHLAVQSLHQGECDRAIAGGVSLMLLPEPTIALSKARMLSPSGRCRAFDAAADGYVRGEGCGLVVLRRLADAVAGGDTILGVIRASAVNQDGRSNGITAPNGPAQEQVIRQALARSGLSPAEVSYVEAHGTGTALGDPIEMRALANVFAADRRPERPLLVGSVKTNIGHLEAAAGVAGLIKTVLAIRHGEIPANLHLATPNPYILWDEIPVQIPTAPTAWSDQHRRAGVSSFGFSGTNAHLVVEAPPTPAPDRPAGLHQRRDAVVVKLAAQGTAALSSTAARLGAWVQAHPEAPLEAVAWTADTGRADLPDRAAVVAATREELLDGLAVVAEGERRAGVVRGRAASSGPTTAFLVPGQGATTAGAAAELYRHEPVFRYTLDRLAEVLGPLDQLPLAALIEPTSEAQTALTQTENAQPALYALAVALADWWGGVGIRPDAVVGHSAGAYAAAAIAGVFGVEDGAALVAARGRLMAELAPRTGMATVAATPSAVAEVLDAVDDPRVVVAVVNSPVEVVVAGPRDALGATLERFSERGIRCRWLDVAHAFHTAHVEPALGPLEDALTTVPLRPPALDLVSDTSGEVAGPDAATPRYWVDHTRREVRFDLAVQTLRQLGCSQLVELGSGTALLSHAHDTFRDTAAVLLPSLRSGRPPRRQLQTSAATAWAEGASLDWRALNHPPPPQRANLPTYPFQRTRHWLPTGTSVGPPPSQPAPAQADPSDSSPASVPSDQAGQTTPDRGELLRLLDAVRPAERPAALRRRVRHEVATILGVDAGDLDTTDVGLFDVGMDSLMAVELRSRLVHLLDRDLPKTVVLDHPTIDGLASHLLTQVFEPEQSPDGRPGRRRPRHHDPIAIVGMACRFPGGGNDLESFWALLRDGRDAVSDVPVSRWDADAFYDPDPQAPFKMYTRQGAFLDTRIDEFDASMFGISPREATAMDPQQRLLLEVSWEALEDAGLPIDQLAGTRTAVYVGTNTADYAHLMASGGATDVDAYVTTGNTASMAAGRLSHLLGLQGPSLSVDTACSSSLVAAHLACQGLRSGEADLAIVAGVNLMLSPATTIGMAKLRALAVDGRCKAFDAAADGYGRGEGCGVVVLKRLSDAQADGDRVWAVLRGTAVNQDGRSAGLTVPNGPAQEAVIGEAVDDAGVDPTTISYVEAHGTGTPLGDPIELQAAAAALRGPGASAPPLLVGSVKTNIGHLEAAAGVAGLIKVALALHHGELPAHLHLRDPSPHVAWDDLPVTILTERSTWPTRPDGPRLAGISSFGFSGTNAHVVLEEAPTDVEPPRPEPGEPSAPPEASAASARLEASAASEAGGQELLLVSARSPEALRDLAGRYAAAAADVATAGARWADRCAAAAVRRSHETHRLAVVGTPDEVAAALADVAQGRPRPDVAVGRAMAMAPRLLFAFCGQGAAWLGMGRRLLATEPAFREVVETCDRLVRDQAGWSVVDELWADPSRSRLEDTEVAQPVLFAVQVGLAALWASWSVRPDAVIGHSVGEVAAAHVAGALELADAVRVVVRRGQVMQSAHGQGAMAVVGLGEDATTDLVARLGSAATVAAVNGPTLTIVAGPHDSVGKVVAAAQRDKVFARTLDVDYAFHSPQMEALGDELVGRLEGLSPRDPEIPMYSTVEPGRAGDLGPGYWGRGIATPVRFLDALRQAAADELAVAVEIGPHPVHATVLAEVLGAVGVPAPTFASMVRSQDDRTAMLRALGGLHTVGRPIDHRRRWGGQVRWAPLPSYAWQRQRYWHPDAQVVVPGTDGPGRPAARSDRQSRRSRLAPALGAVTWQPAPRPRPRPEGPQRRTTDPGTWLLVEGESGLGTELELRLRSIGEHCHVVRRGHRAATDLGRLVATLVEDATPPLRGVVHLGGATPPSRSITLGDLDSATAAGSVALLDLVQGLAKGSTAPSRPRLWVVTRGTQPVTGDGGRISPAQAPLWGLARVVALEHPELWGGLVDLDPQPRPDEADVLFDEITDPDGEDQVAYRAGQRSVARFRRDQVELADARAADELHLSPEASYLVTGGRGSLGLRTARWLTSRGARHLVLLGRRPLPERHTWPGLPADHPMQEVVACIHDLEGDGVTVHTPAVDVCDLAALTAVLDSSATPWPRPRGVVHAAGTFQMQSLRETTAADLRRVLAAKVQGTWNLHELTMEADLDFFVLFSSAASVWGTALGGHYAAANHFLDVFAHYRATLGLPALAVNWGWWADSHMASPEARDYFTSIGLGMLDDDLAFQALEELLIAGSRQATVAPVEWNRFKPILEAKRRRPLLDLIDVREGPADGNGPSDVVLRLRGAPARSRPELMASVLDREVAAVLGMGPGQRLDPQAGFFEIGLDSIMAVELAQRLKGVLGVGIPSTTAFEHPSIDALAAHLLDRLDLGECAADAVEAADAEAGGRPVDEIGELSEGELLNLLAAELEELSPGSPGSADQRVSPKTSS